MDYMQAFCGAVAVAYFIWVAKCWWSTDREALDFQRKVALVLFAALVLDVTYTYGVVRGSGAVLETFQRAMHVDPSNPPKVADKAPAESSASSPFDDVLIPKWATFYLLVIWGEIALAVTMPERKRTHRQAAEKPAQGNSDGTAAEPDRAE